MRWFFWLTGGRPMRYIRAAFWDAIEHRVVNYYEDRRTGIRYLATNRWGIFRVPAGVTWP